MNDDKMPPGSVDDVDVDVRAAMDELSKAPEAAAPASSAANDGAPDLAEKPSGQSRDPATGRFSKSDERAEPATGTDPKPPASVKGSEAGGAESAPAEGPATAPPAAASTHRPPPGWSVPAKAAWDKLPPEVQAAIANRETEVNNGFATLKEFKDLKPYADMATRSGTTLAQALERFTGLETMLRSQPEQGLIRVAQNLGWSQQDAAKNFLALAQKLGAQVPAPASQTANGAAQPAAAHQGGTPPELQAVLQPVLTPLLQEINTLKSTLSQQTEADRNRKLEAAKAVVEAFANDPKFPYYANLEESINALFSSGMVQRTGDLRRDLETAYEMASWQNAEVRAALIKQQQETAEADRKAKEKEAADKAAKASRSVSGSAAPGVVHQAPRQYGDDDITADVRAAMGALR